MINNLLQYQEDIRRHIKDIKFVSPYAITIQLSVPDEIQAHKTIERFHKKYKRLTGQRRKRTNFIAVLEKTMHFHCHILTDRPSELNNYEQRVNNAISTTKQIYANYNHTNEVLNDGWGEYITKFQNANDEFSIWESR